MDTHKFALPVIDANAPDLYIPLMGFMTFVILNGFARGASNSFTPQVGFFRRCQPRFSLSLSVLRCLAHCCLCKCVNWRDSRQQSLVQTTSSCLVMEIIQVLATRVALQLMQVTIPWLDLFAYSGYKYVMLCAITASWLIFGDAVYLLAFLYMGAALVFFTVRTCAMHFRALASVGIV